jgi:cytochrome c oxidase subunit 4
MVESHVSSPGEVAEEHAESPHVRYLLVWVALLVFTLIEYFYAALLKDVFVILLLGLLLWAAIKAGMVGWYFMHLKFEGAWVYLVIIPAFVLATILVLALSPDVAMRPAEEESEATTWSAPREPAPNARFALGTCRAIAVDDRTGSSGPLGVISPRST